MPDIKDAPGTRGLDHVGLNVPDLDEAIDFFASQFNARVKFRLGPVSDPDGGSMERLGADRMAQFELAMLEIGAGRLELLRWWVRPDHEAPFSGSDVGSSHVAIAVSDVSVALARLRDTEGVRVIGEPVTFTSGATPGLTNAFVTSPWGSLIELVDWGL